MLPAAGPGWKEKYARVSITQATRDGPCHRQAHGCQGVLPALGDFRQAAVRFRMSVGLVRPSPGDGGLVVAMFWGVALALLSLSGFLVYTQMWRRTRTGFRRFFW